MTVQTAADEAVQREAKRPPMRLGEELPIFCERCGYSLHGLPQARCERCTILHFVCPECNHHQPINNLRPAFQWILGRMRAFVLLMVVLFKINFFFWCLAGWWAFGYDWSYEYQYRPTQTITPAGIVMNTVQPNRFTPRVVEDLFEDEEVLVGITLLALGFGVAGRMFALRWRRGFFVGSVMGALVVLALVLGALFRQIERSIDVTPLIQDFWIIAAWCAALVITGTAVAWPIWSGLVRLLMPRETANAFLEWQRGLSQRTTSLARQ